MNGPDNLRLSKRDLLRLSKRAQLRIPTVVDFHADQLRLSKKNVEILPKSMMRLSRASAPKILHGLDMGLSNLSRLSKLSKRSNAAQTGK